MSVRFDNSLTAIAMAICFATVIANADDRAPTGVAAGVEKPLRIAPRPGNGRNSEGDFIRLKDGRLMLIYTKFVGKSDHATAELVGDIQPTRVRPGPATMLRLLPERKARQI